MRVLVDMDGVIANWGKQWDHVLNTYWPESRAPRHAQQRSFDLKAGLDEYDRDVVNMVMDHPHFYRDIEPMPGAVEALHDMVEAGYTVNICTSPWLSNPTCVQDKLSWLDAHVGEGWAKRAVVTMDKTLVHGDVLIDDKPSVTGSHEPTWEHVLFDQPYNREVVGQRRICGWQDWQGQLLEAAA